MKISTGEELIGEVSQTSDKFVIKEPCAMQMMPPRNDPNRVVMGMFPIAQHLKNNTIEISNNHIIYSGEPVEELYNQYSGMFGTGIQIPLR